MTPSDANKALWPPPCVMVIAIIPCLPALFLIWALFLRCGPTRYAPGFTESKFASLKVGMTAEEVEAVVGPPLDRIAQYDGDVLWTYSDREDDTCGFEMRWVYLRAGKVKEVVNREWLE